ncbi:MAG: hypothetical protein IT372_36385 [Polyangiaceae bacterium]|nr:hypothetical protein [Polyangiaceae bacterium]
MKRLLALGAALATSLLSAAALACPQCAAGRSGGSLQKIGLGLFLMLPFVVAGIIVKIIRAQGDEGAMRALGSTWDDDSRRRQSE